VHGARFLLSHRVLWKFAIAPSVIGTVLFAGAYAALYHFGGSFAGAHQDGPWYIRTLVGALFVLAAVGAAVVLLFLFAKIASAIASPFNDLISDKTEQLVSDRYVETPFSSIALMKNSARAIRHSFKLLAIQAAVLACSFLLLLVPLAGAFLFPVAGALLSSFLMAFEYLGYSMDRRGYTWNEKKAFLRAHRSPALGFGLGCVATTTIPFVNLLFIPIAAVGGTLLFLELEKSGKRSIE
jgi:CysZ protein